MVHATDEAALIADICRAIVDASQYAAGLGGLRRARARRSVRSSRRTADRVPRRSPQLGRQRVRPRSHRHGHSYRHVQVIKDLRRSKRIAPQRDRIEKYGFRSFCSFPLERGRDARSAPFRSTAATPGPSSRAEVELSRARRGPRVRHRRMRDAELLARNEAHLREAERLAHVGHWEWDLRNGRFEFMADEMFAIYGISPASGRAPTTRFCARRTRRAATGRRRLTRALADGTAELLHKIRAPDGKPRSVRMRAEAVRDETGRPSESSASPST